MSRSTHHDLLLKLGDTDLNHRFAGADLRNRKVLGPDGKDISHVSALFLDRAECQVRFLQVGTGGFLGLGEREFLIPVDDVSITEPAEVQIAHTREQVLAEPHYDPQAAARQGVLGHLLWLLRPHALLDQWELKP